MRDDTIDQRLKDWGREYRGGRYENLGYPSQSSHLSIPGGNYKQHIDIDTPGDEIEKVVQAMEAGEYYRPAKVLRIHYVTPDHWDIQTRLGKLRLIGVSVSRSKYFQLLEVGKAYVDGTVRRKHAA